jgi:predicted dehydrogenase
MIRVGIIGCGKIADAHAGQIQRIPGAVIVGACDREELMAKQLCERFSIPSYHSDQRHFLDACKPDVVHITTPPPSHFEIGKICLESGCNVYMEKPFTINTGEAVELLNIADAAKKKITVGHDYQFTHAKRRMRELVKMGYLGGPPILMESYHFYDLGSESYAKALLGDKKYWVRSLPGTLMHNNISHGVASIAEFMDGGDFQVTAKCFRSKLLESIGETEIVDEARVIISQSGRSSAYLTFSTQVRPVLHQFRMYGSENGLIVDHDQQTCIRVSGKKQKSYLEKFFSPLQLGGQYVHNALGNMSLFVKNDFHMKSGMKYLIEAFYKSVVEDAPLPIPYGEMLITSRIMDEIFRQIQGRDA